MALFAQTDIALPIATAAIAALATTLGAVLPVWLKLRHERITREIEARESQKQQDSLESGASQLENQLVSALSRLHELEGRVSQLESEVSASQRAVSESPRQPAQPITEYFLMGPRGAVARGRTVAEGFLIHEGSCVAIDVVPSIPPSAFRERERLLEEGVLVRRGERITFSRDYVFNSASRAAGVVLGRSANGLLEWKDREGCSLGGA